MPNKNTLVERSAPIERFRISCVSKSVNKDTLDSIGSFYYGFPEERQYDHPNGGTYTRCRIEVYMSTKGDAEFAGYLPLPNRYREGWIQLCYNIVYRRKQWEAWAQELNRPGQELKAPVHFLEDCMKNNGIRLLQYLTARRYIIEELLNHFPTKNNTDELRLFDEYLIRDRRSWLWTEPSHIPEKECLWLSISLVDPADETAFGEVFSLALWYWLAQRRS
ncbi:hypothetical protein OG21DRAFT_161087 [Imleria badia]|nr:hypothetical protein OG21DRAFT_161087 [Imleria badia]